MLRAFVLARIVEPTSKLDSLRVIEEVGSTHRRTRPSNADCRCPPTAPGDEAWLRRALRIHG